MSGNSSLTEPLTTNARSESIGHIAPSGDPPDEYVKSQVEPLRRLARRETRGDTTQERPHVY
jgi:hypothetical protein